MDPKPIEAFGASLQEYYNNKCLSDVVIRCEGQEFAVHSLVLFCHSDYFKRQLTGPWRESEDRIIEIKDFSANIVEAMVRFIYAFDYDVPPNTPPMIFHAKVYQVGDKYGIETLKRQSLNKFKPVIESAEVTTEYASDLADAITTVYTTTPPEDRGLRDIVMNSSHSKLRQLMSKEPFKESLSLKVITIQSDAGETFTCRCYRCQASFTMRIDSLPHNINFPNGRKPVRCPVCSWKPSPAENRDEWLFYHRPAPWSAFKQVSGRNLIDLW